MIRELIEENLIAVVDLHKKVLGNTLNSRIGGWFLKKLYEVMQNSSDNGICYVDIEDGEVLGFISFCFDHERIEKEIMASLSLMEKIKVASFLAIRPWLWPIFVRQLLFARYLGRNFIQPYASILTLGVSTKIQGKGIGKRLVDSVKELALQKGSVGFFVDTEVKNIKAEAFYIKNGFKKIGVKCGNIILKYSSNGTE